MRPDLAARETRESHDERDANLIERLNKEVMRRADVVGIVLNEAAIIRLVGGVLRELALEGINQYDGGYTEYVARAGQKAPGLHA